jgi:hypothetical protein
MDGGSMSRANAAKGVVLLTLATELLTPGSSLAAIGAGISASPIMLAKPAAPGRSYALPRVYILNTGTVSARYHVRVQRLSRRSARTLPASWVTFGRNDILLRPRTGVMVPLRVRVPDGTTSGPYLSDVVVSTLTPRQVGGTAIGAGAATLLQMTVSDSGSAIPLLPIGALAGVLAVVVIARRIRRSGIRLRLQVERR